MVVVVSISKTSRMFNVLFAKGVEILAIRAIPNSL